MLRSPNSWSSQLKRTQYWSTPTNWDFVVVHSVACCTDAGVRSSATGVEGECFLHRGQNKRVVCYVSVSLVLLPAMHNECPRHALSIEFEYKLTRVSLTRLPRLGPNSICVKASVPLFRLQLGSKPWKRPIERLTYLVLQHLVKGTIHKNTKAYCIKEEYSIYSKTLETY